MAATKPVGFRELQRQLDELAARGRDPSPVFTAIARDFRQAQAQQYATGRGWKKVSLEYAARKARMGHGDRVGVFTGGLRDSLVNVGDHYHEEKITSDLMSVESKDPVWKLFGGRHKTRQQPKRKPIRLTPTMRRTYLGWAQQYLESGRLP